MMNKVFIIFIICAFCCGSRQDQQTWSNIFEEHGQKGKHPLDMAIEKSREEKKPILLWVSFHGNATDGILMRKLNQISGVRDYMSDSIIYCRLIVGDKTHLQKMPDFVTKLKEQASKDFSTIGSLNEWICEKFFDNQNHFLIITNTQLDKLSDYYYNKNFDHDTTSFLTFLKKGYNEYRLHNSKQQTVK